MNKPQVILDDTGRPAFVVIPWRDYERLTSEDAEAILRRAALLTGLYPHQAGIGHMAGGIPNAPGYGGQHGHMV